MAVLSDPSCAEVPAELPPGGVLAGAGPDVPVVVEPAPEPVEDDDVVDDCSKYTKQCGTSGGIEILGGYYPKSCGCPAGMRDEGGSHLNELCGLLGSGYECRYCACP